MSVQKELARYVKEHNINHRELALRCGWNLQKLSCLLRCKRPLGSADYGLLCEALDVPYDYFYIQNKENESSTE